MLEYTGNEPRYMSEGAAGMDLVADVNVILQPGEQVLINTGTSVAIPDCHFGLLLPRSSLCNKKGLIMTNSAGVIDSDYRGEMKCCYRNIGDDVVEIKKGERICQLIIIPFASYLIPTKVDNLTETERGSGGFGSTNVKT